MPGAAPICHPSSLLQLVCTHWAVLSPVYPMYEIKALFLLASPVFLPAPSGSGKVQIGPGGEWAEVGF